MQALSNHSYILLYPPRTTLTVPVRPLFKRHIPDWSAGAVVTTRTGLLIAYTESIRDGTLSSWPQEEPTAWWTTRWMKCIYQHSLWHAQDVPGPRTDSVLSPFPGLDPPTQTRFAAQKNNNFSLLWTFDAHAQTRLTAAAIVTTTAVQRCGTRETLTPLPHPKSQSLWSKWEVSFEDT